MKPNEGQEKGVTPLCFLGPVVPIRSVITFPGLSALVRLLSVVNVPVSLSFV
jgi:hypothetical protein